MTSRRIVKKLYNQSSVSADYKYMAYKIGCKRNGFFSEALKGDTTV